MENHLLATLSQQQVLSQEQQQSLRILQMPTQELLGEIELMLESNPLLEVEEPAQASDDPQARAQEHDDDRRDDRGEDDSEFDAAQAETPVDQPYEAWQGASSDEAPFERIPAPESFRDELLADLGCLPLIYPIWVRPPFPPPCRSRRASICSSPALSRSSTTGASSRPRSRRSCATTRASSRRKASRT